MSGQGKTEVRKGKASEKVSPTKALDALAVYIRLVDEQKAELKRRAAAIAHLSSLAEELYIAMKRTEKGVLDKATCDALTVPDISRTKSNGTKRAEEYIGTALHLAKPRLYGLYEDKCYLGREMKEIKKGLSKAMDLSGEDDDTIRPVKRSLEDHLKGVPLLPRVECLDDDSDVE